MKERFLILARESGNPTANLKKVLATLGRVEIVVDRKTDEADSSIVWVPDEEAEAFGGMMSNSGSFPWVTAWSRALCHLSRTLDENEGVWLIEDDVAGDAESFAALVQGTATMNVDLTAVDIRTGEEDSHWPLWHYAEGFFTQTARAFLPLCRLSGRLARAILECRAKHGRCTFHEVMFPSVAREQGMSWRSWNGTPHLKRHLGAFRFRPSVDFAGYGISHPVKDEAVHETICALPPAEFPRLRHAACQGWSILLEDYVFLSRYCKRMNLGRVIEFGPGDSTLAFLDAGCRIASFEHDAEWLRKATERFDGEHAVALTHCPEGTVPLAENLEFAPEMVFVDGPPFREGQEMSRLQPCEWALEQSGSFILHDAKREAEMATLAEMERRNLHVTRIPTRKGLAIVIDPKRRPELVAGSTEEIAARYGGGEGWWRQDLLAWQMLFGNALQPVKVLEIGAGQGASANLLLDLLFSHRNSEIHCIDPYDDADGVAHRATFEMNGEKSGNLERLRLYEGLPREVLAWMIAEEGYWKSFDFIHLASSTEATSTLADACQAWELLKPGGVMVFNSCPGRDGWSGVEAFLNVFENRLEPILEGQQRAVRKIR